MSLLRTLLTPRWLNAAGLLACVGAMVGALLLQHYAGLEPCPLCIFQRIGVIVAGVFFLLALAHNPGAKGQRIYAVLAATGVIGGGIVAGRHVWLQHLPPEQVPDCGPGLQYMLDVFPMQEVISMVLYGSGECAKVDWAFLGISLPGWSLLVFLGLGALVIMQWLLSFKKQA